MSIHRTLETASNVCIILVALAIGWVLYAKSSVQTATEQSVLARGESLKVSNVNWSANKRTVVLILRKGCHLCDESSDFHQRVVRRAGERGVAVIAVLPDDERTGKIYVQALGLSVADVRQANLQTLRVPRVPAVIITDHRGAVQRVWLGKLLPPDEDEVLATIG